MLCAYVGPYVSPVSRLSSGPDLGRAPVTVTEHVWPRITDPCHHRASRVSEHVLFTATNRWNSFIHQTWTSEIPCCSYPRWQLSQVFAGSCYTCGHRDNDMDWGKANGNNNMLICTALHRRETNTNTKHVLCKCSWYCCEFVTTNLCLGRRC